MKKGITIFIIGSIICLLLSGFTACKPKATEPIKLGYVAGITGFAAAKVKHLTNGVELAVNEINAAGGILGQKVELLTYDSKSVPEEGVSVVQKAIYNDKVNAIMGTDASDVAVAFYPIVMKAGIPFANIMTISNSLVRHPGEYGFFSTAHTTKGDASAQCYYMEKVLGVKSVAVIGTEMDWLRDNYDATKEIWDRPGSPVKLTPLYAYPFGTQDLSPTVLKAVGEKTDVIWSYDWTIVGAIQIYNILKDLGYKGIIWQTCGTLSPDVIQGAKAASEGAWSHAVWDPVFTNPESVAFVEALKKAYGPDVMVTGVSDVTEMGYVGVNALCLAMDKAGTATDVKKIDETLFKLDFVMPTGAKFALDETGWLTRVDEHYIQVVNGQMVLKDVVPASKINDWLAGK